MDNYKLFNPNDLHIVGRIDPDEVMIRYFHRQLNEWYDKKKKEDDNLITVKSPMIGTFYRSSGPEKDPFVNVGSSFKVGDKLCIIEAMKTFNEIEAEVSGKIVKVLVDDASPVDYEQPLFLVEPA